MREQQKILRKFDQNGDGWLNAAERKAAREFLVKERAQSRQRGPRRGPPMEASNPPEPGAKIRVEDARSFPGEPLYTSNVVRTLFLEFEDADWEKDLSDFHGTDVDVAARLTVDGKSYPDVGVHFRGASSYMMVGEGFKRSLNLSVDAIHDHQALLGYRTLNLLNSHEDPSFLRSVLFYDIARSYIPAPRANFVRVVINGESWGIYVNVEQINKDFAKEWFRDGKVARWKVPGSPRGEGSLRYLGDDPSSYKRIYQIKTKDDPASWSRLIELCRVLDRTPTNELERALEPLLDVNGTLRFLALDNALINNDGFWIRTSDYDICLDARRRFHLVPWDANETFSRPGGPGFGPPGRAPGGAMGPPRQFQGPPQGEGTRVTGVALDPLVGLNDPNKTLRSKLLAVPALRARYLQYVREIAETWLDWSRLGPIAAHYHDLIAPEVKADTRKLDSTADFEQSLTRDIPGRRRGPGGGGTIALKNFADQRREYLLRVIPK